ncbi:MAG: FG-GAP-like repeat-containing protein [Gallionella sp.]|nr:FG-GAP-like repeat-containing protein [Gallionella sp.]
MILLRKLAVKRTVIGLAAAGLVSGLLLAGCGGGSSSSSPSAEIPAGTSLTLAAGLKGSSGGFVPASTGSTSYDLLVGAPGATNRKGALLVVKDGDVNFSSYIEGEAAGDYFGSSFAKLGDVTGAWKQYFAVGAMYATGNASLSGAVYVYERTATSENLLVKLKGDNAMDRFGWDIASGDLNADGIKDIIVAAPYTFTDEAGYQSGAVYVYFGGSTLSATPNVKITGVSLNSGIGLALETGDINGDGVADLFFSGGGKLGTRVMVFYGGTDFATRVSSATTPDVAITTGKSGFGNALAYLGDVNGDGIGDIAIGSPRYSTYGSTASYDNKGAVYIFKGGAALPATITYADATFATYLLAHIKGENNGDQFGSSIAWVGGATNDILIGARWATGGTATLPLTDSGNVYRFSLTALLGDPPVPNTTATIADAVQTYPAPLASGDYGRNLDIGNGVFFTGAHLLHTEEGVAYRKYLNPADPAADEGSCCL